MTDEARIKPTKILDSDLPKPLGDFTEEDGVGRIEIGGVTHEIKRKAEGWHHSEWRPDRFFIRSDEKQDWLPLRHSGLNKEATVTTYTGYDATIESVRVGEFFVPCSSDQLEVYFMTETGPFCYSEDSARHVGSLDEDTGAAIVRPSIEGVPITEDDPAKIELSPTESSEDRIGVEILAFGHRWEIKDYNHDDLVYICKLVKPKSVVETRDASIRLPVGSTVEVLPPRWEDYSDLNCGDAGIHQDGRIYFFAGKKWVAGDGSGEPCFEPINRFSPAKITSIQWKRVDRRT